MPLTIAAAPASAGVLERRRWPGPTLHGFGLAALTLPRLLLLGLALRLVALAFPCAVHPDEVFQYLEPAYRLLHGTGVVTWEWRLGIRSWLIPMLVAGPMRVGEWLGPDSAWPLVMPRLLMTFGALGTIAVAWRLGERLSRTHAKVAGLVAAIWYEAVYFAPHVMSETLAVALILPAALLLTDRSRDDAARIATAGALLGLAASMRFQYLPAIAVLLLATCGGRVRQSWAPLLAGGLIGLLPAAAADCAMGRLPYAWLLENVRQNFVLARSEDYGVSGPFGLLAEFWPRWSLWGIGIVALAVKGHGRYPALGWTALANLLFHSAIAHKEYRFVLLSVMIAVILAAIGTVDLARDTARAHGAEAGRKRMTVLLVAWFAASASIGFGAFRGQWAKFGQELSSFAALRADPALCGIGVYRHDYSMTGGYAYLRRDVPITLYIDGGAVPPWTALARSGRAINTVMTEPVHARELPPGYARLSCRGSGAAQLCLYRRPGGCDPRAGAGYTMNEMLAAYGA